MAVASPPKCLNLREIAGRTYRVAKEESYYAQYGPRAIVEDPWLLILPGTNGHVYPWNASKLAATTNKRGRVSAALAALPGVEVWQDGDDGITILFSPDLLPQVAALLRLRRRRPPMTPEQIAASRERLAKYAFRPAVGASQTSAVCVGISELASQSTPSPQPTSLSGDG